MFTDAEMAEERAAAEARMLDDFTLKRSLGINYDPGTDAEVETFETLFTTKGRVKSSSGLVARESEAGGRTVVSVTRTLHIPVGSPAISFDDGPVYAFCDAVDVTSDPSLEGARLRLAGPAPGSQTTARRLEVEEELT